MKDKISMLTWRDNKEAGKVFKSAKQKVLLQHKVSFLCKRDGHNTHKMVSRASKNFISIKLKLSFDSLQITLGHWVNLLISSDMCVCVCLCLCILYYELFGYE